MVADLLITDPPYNVDYSSKNEMLNRSGKGNRIQTPIKNDNMSDADFENFLTDVFYNVEHFLKAGGVFYVWCIDNKIDIFMRAIKHNHLYHSETLIWNKNNFVLGRLDYHKKHEPCLYGWKEGAGHYFCDSRAECTVIDDIPSFKKMSKLQLIKWVKEYIKPDVATSVIDEDKPMANKIHPTMKPVKLIGYEIQNSSRVGDTVLDVFGGSGSTLIACEQLNRKCRTMELDPNYCKVIIKRWEQLTGKKAELIEEG